MKPDWTKLQLGLKVLMYQQIAWQWREAGRLALEEVLLDDDGLQVVQGRRRHLRRLMNWKMHRLVCECKQLAFFRA